MRRFVVAGFAIVLGAGAAGVVGASAASPGVDRPGSTLAGARTFALPNGLTVVTLRDASRPVVAVQMLYRVGARDETIGITGIAHFVEHMLFRGSKSFGLKDVTGVIERAGGEWHGYTTLDCTTFFEAAPRDLLPTLLRLEAERMTAARMASDEVDPERGAVFEEYRGYQNDPRSDLFDATMATLFLEHPYRNNTMGWESDLAGIGHDDLVAFYERYYGPRNGVLAVAGDFEEDVLERLVRQTFGPIPARGDRTLVRTIEPPLTGARRIVLRRPGAEPALMIAFLAPPPSRPGDHAALRLLDAILGHAKGLSFYRHSDETTAGADVDRASRLGSLLAGGPAARFGTSLLPTLYPYAYSLYAAPRPGRSAAEIEPQIFGALQEAARTITPAEVDAARLRVEAADLLETDSLVERTHELAFWTGLGDPGTRQRALDALGGVGAEAVRALAATLTRDHAVIGTLLPEDLAETGRPAPPAGPEAGGSVAPSGSGAGTGRRPSTGAPPRHTEPPRRAERPALATLDLATGGRAIVDSRPGLSTFVLRLAIDAGGAGADRLRAAGDALDDTGVRDLLAALGVELAVEGPGEGRLAESDTLQVILQGPAGALLDGLAALGPALARSLSTRVSRPESPSRDPGGRARQILRGATTAGAGAERAAGAGRSSRPVVAIALVAPFAPSSLRAPLEGLARGALPGLAAFPAGVGAPPAPNLPAGAGAGARGAALPPGRRVETLPDIAQGRLLFAFDGSADPGALEALAYVLHHRYSGRLGVKAIAEMGLVYSMQSEVVGRAPAYAYVTMGAVPASLPRLEAALDEVLDRTADGVSEEEVAEYRSFSAGDLEVRMTDPEKAARLLASALLRGEDHSGPAEAARRARGVTRERVTALARTSLPAGRRLTIVVTRAAGAGP